MSGITVENFCLATKDFTYGKFGHTSWVKLIGQHSVYSWLKSIWISHFRIKSHLQ
jgi:hypothetical protein